MRKILLDTKFLVFFSIILEIILFYFYYFPENKVLFGDEVRYLETGVAIVNGGDWHPDPLWPPMQAVLIAVFVKLFDHSILPLQIFQYGLLLLAGFIVRDIVYKESKNQLAAQVALAIMILYPSWLAYSQYLWPEVIHVTLLCAIFWIVNYRFNSYKWMLFLGLLIGLVILFKSLIILFIPFIYLPLFTKLKPKKALTLCMLSLVIAIIIITPASQKAHKTTAGWMVANSSMFNLWLGLNDDSRQHFAHKLGGKYHAEYMQSADNYTQRNKLAKEKAIIKIQQDGYLNTFIQQSSKQYFRLFDHQTFFSQQFKSKDKRFVSKYSHQSNEVLVTIIVWFNNFIYSGLMLTLIIGIFASVKNSVLAKQFLLFGLYVAGLFLLLHAIPRFRIPLLPMMAFFSAYAYHSYQQNSFVISKQKTIAYILYAVFVASLVFAGALLDKYSGF